MSFLADLVAKAQSMLEAPKPSERNAIKANSFDRADWKEVLETTPAMQRVTEELRQSVDYVDDFMQDLHSEFYKIDPTVLPADQMLPTHVANRAVTEQMLEMPEVRNLRQHSVGDKYGSAMAITAMQEVATETLTRINEAVEEAEKRREEAEKRREEAGSDLGQLIEQAQNGEPNAQTEGLLQAKMDQFDQAQQQAQQAQQQAQEQATTTCEGMSNKIRSAAKEVTQKLDDEQELMSAFGVDPGEVQRMNVQERIELAKKIQNNRLAKFAKLLGQFKMVQQAESRKRVTNAASEVHGVTQSDELTRMIAGEFLNFADPSLETLMWLRWSEHQLNTYDVRGKENLGQGPIICVVDESGSMQAEDVAGGSREAWSKALALCLADQARRRKRDFIYIGFSSPGQQHVVEFPNGESTLPRVMAMTEHFFGGGTHYERPLMMALEIIETKFDAHGKARPDIVFITDDEYGSMDPTFMANYNRVKDKASIKCYGISLGCGYSGALQQISDNVRSVTELVSDPRSVGDLFRTI